MKKLVKSITTVIDFNSKSLSCSISRLVTSLD